MPHETYLPTGMLQDEAGESCPQPLLGPENASAAARVVADMQGPEAMPRKNGELLFEAPWEGRAFGMVVSLHQQGLFDWDEFRDKLIAEIAAAEQRQEPPNYYERWLAAFEKLLTAKGLCSGAELDERTEEFEHGERDEVF